READDPAGAGGTSRAEEVARLRASVLAAGGLVGVLAADGLQVRGRQQRRIVVGEHERFAVVRVNCAARAFVAGAGVAGRVVPWLPLGTRFLDLALPRTLGPLRRDQHPLVP